ncbi:MAG: hypothetical protein ABUL46_00475, partial [Chitinophaga rupis]
AKNSFLFVPVTLATALLLCWWILPPGRKARLTLLNILRQIYRLERYNKNAYQKIPTLRQSTTLKQIYHRKWLKGDLLPAEYQKAVIDLDTMTGDKEGQLISRRMEFGHSPQPLRNAWQGLGFGALVATFAYLIYFKLYLVDDPGEFRGLPTLLESDASKLILFHISPVINGSLAGFCLGYFFPFLRGKTGWEKGAWLGAAIGVAGLPMIYLTGEAEGWAPVIAILYKHVLLCMLTGFLAFDLRTIRKLDGRPLSGKTIVEWMGWTRTLALGTFFLAAIGAGVTAWGAGNIQDLLKAIFGGK